MSSESSSRDPIIGLEVGDSSRIFYCHRSTLTNAVGSYFAARFDPDGSLSPGESYTDERGRKIYFIDRNSKAFEYVLEYLRTKKVPGLPDFHENRTLWRQLREEAAFYSLDGLSSLVKVTYSCSPEHTDQGVLYWLGTRKGTTEYQNPFKIGAVHVGGWVDDLPTTVAVFDDGNWIPYELGGSVASRASFVQYRPEVSEPCEFMPFCGDDIPNAVVFVDLKEIQLRPTHYSIRAADCFGMIADWNLEGSLDGNNWAVLHEGRENDYINLDEICNTPEFVAFTAVHEEVRSEFVTRASEHYCRRTWDLSNSVGPDAFYRFFRIRKVSEEGHLHGAGLELFGDVFES